MYGAATGSVYGHARPGMGFVAEEGSSAAYYGGDLSPGGGGGGGILGEVWRSGFDFQRLRPLMRRALRGDQMDFEAALDEMLSMCFCQPARVFKQAYYRKQTKDAWARDDPAFALLQVAFLAVAAVAYGCALGVARPAALAYLAGTAVVGCWLGCGLVLAGAHCAVANYALRERTRGARSVSRTVEFQYAFDTHCNAFFAYFLVAVVAHFFLLPLALGHSFLAMALGNCVHVAAAAAYFYVTHLGFRSLPFLQKTEVFLYPVLAAAGALVVTLGLGVFGININVSRLLVAAVLAPIS